MAKCRKSNVNRAMRNSLLSGVDAAALPNRSDVREDARDSISESEAGTIVDDGKPINLSRQGSKMNPGKTLVPPSEFPELQKPKKVIKTTIGMALDLVILQIT